MHPNVWRIIHVRRLTSTSLTNIVSTIPIGIVHVAVQSGCGQGTRLIIPRVMLFATVRQLREQIVHRVVSYVCRFIPVIDAAFIGTFPIGVEQRSGANSGEVAHASIVVPAEVCAATAIQCGA